MRQTVRAFRKQCKIDMLYLFYFYIYMIRLHPKTPARKCPWGTSKKSEKGTGESLVKCVGHY